MPPRKRPTSQQRKNVEKRELTLEDDGTHPRLPSDTRTAKKKREVAGVAKPPTARYQPFSLAVNNVGAHVTHALVTFANHDGYTLFMVPTDESVINIPVEGVRLDDSNGALTISQFHGHMTARRAFALQFAVGVISSKFVTYHSRQVSARTA